MNTQFTNRGLFKWIQYKPICKSSLLMYVDGTLYLLSRVSSMRNVNRIFDLSFDSLSIRNVYFTRELYVCSSTSPQTQTEIPSRNFDKSSSSIMHIRWISAVLCETLCSELTVSWNSSIQFGEWRHSCVHRAEARHPWSSPPGARNR